MGWVISFEKVCVSLSRAPRLSDACLYEYAQNARLPSTRTCSIMYCYLHGSFVPARGNRAEQGCGKPQRSPGLATGI